MRYIVTLGGLTHEVEIAPEGVTVDGRPVVVDLQKVTGSGVWSLLIDGRSVAFRAIRHGRRGSWELDVGGSTVLAEVVDGRVHALQGPGGSGPSVGPKALKAPMPGLVVAVEVEPGEAVHVGKGLVIIEAMKMENEMSADSPGRVRTVLVEAGQTVERGDVLVEFDPLEDPETPAP